jgi:hypothetical protein
LCWAIYFNRVAVVAALAVVAARFWEISSAVYLAAAVVAKAV